MMSFPAHARQSSGPRWIRALHLDRLLLLAAVPVLQGMAAAVTDAGPGNRPAFTAGCGIQGILSQFEAGIRVPMKNGSTFMAFNARYLSSLTWATYIVPDGSFVSFHPTVVAGAVAFGGTSPMLRDLFRTYGAVELLGGYSFTPWDDMVSHTGNLIGPNITLGLNGFLGLEVFTSPRSAIFLEAGGGVKTMHGDKSNQYVIAGSWLGSGVTTRMGVHFYLK